MPSADPETFEIMPWGVRDAKQVFYRNEGIEGGDSKSMKLIGFGFLRDDKHVYRRGKIVPQANPETFRPIGDHKADRDNGYFTDGERVYCRSRLMSGCDVATFQHIKGAYAKDKNHFYFQGNTFERQNEIAHRGKSSNQ